MLLEIQNVKSSYGLIPAIHEASFYAKKGEILGILGHNGMGKTTLLKTIMGFVKLNTCLLYTSPSPRDRQKSRMPWWA